MCLTGRWVVPCDGCESRASCVWSEARWLPYGCVHRRLTLPQLRRCLHNKKLLFVGDSTNRGMLHYVLERLNASLLDGDKTHEMRVYHAGATTLAFAYYPQFWLAPPQRPVFDRTLYSLINRSRPLENDSSTVLVVGGVHWLATHHLHVLLRVLRREGLQSARIVVKTLGSGFHIPSEGVHYLPKEQQQKLLKHSQGLAAFASHHQMEVVDTFNMTAARYNDFLQGKCACHFHKLVRRKGRGGGYHVTGHINALYSEILLSRICRHAP
ncbi:cadherin-like and PC-esterase domain-containing protein 1 [Schistocerca americana]|uniref:cadherin-like and PC-esterase domain-containing protein 1 n=1 Tax=Schistocerca americana TaxID=7009 RepID=UPI001F4FE060|nr:cadherin-like and PC-esterase domain-containing protein 1 [Schistocerca americana]